MKIAWIIVMVLGNALGVLAQSFTDKINKELTFEKKSQSNTVWVANINGHVEVQGYDGDKVLLEMTRIIHGKTESRLERGKSEIQLGIADLADTLILYVEGGCNHFSKSRQGRRNGNDHGWGYQWERDGRNECQTGYDFQMNFVLKVPAGVNLIVSTVNDGDIKVAGMQSAVEANNVNGGIRLSNVVKEVHCSTINGDVNIDFARNPDKASRFYTLNGDINANFQKGLGANLSFESFNGNFYTNVSRLESMPVSVQKEPSDRGTKYKINGNRFKVGNGGVVLDFETFNGDVYVKEIN